MDNAKPFPLPCGYCDWLNRTTDSKHFTWSQLVRWGIIKFSETERTYEQVEHLPQCIRFNTHRGVPRKVTPPRRGISSFFARLFGG